MARMAIALSDRGLLDEIRGTNRFDWALDAELLRRELVKLKAYVENRFRNGDTHWDRYSAAPRSYRMPLPGEGWRRVKYFAFSRRELANSPKRKLRMTKVLRPFGIRIVLTMNGNASHRLSDAFVIVSFPEHRGGSAPHEDSYWRVMDFMSKTFHFVGGNRWRFDPRLTLRGRPDGLYSDMVGAAVSAFQPGNA
jgi:hypothetical protein